MWEERQKNKVYLNKQNKTPSSFLAQIVFVLIYFIYPYFGMRVCASTYMLHLVPKHLGNIQLREANGVHDYIKERTIKIGNHVIETRETVRMIAKEFGVSKSTVHKDLTERLPDIDPLLANRVKEILEYHKSVRHIRGGEATRMKYKREGKQECDTNQVH